jgi:hypothetical protein
MISMKSVLGGPEQPTARATFARGFHSMKNFFLPVFAILALTLSVSALAEETSSPVPIHRTTAKHRPYKPTKKLRPATVRKPSAPAAASAAK